MKIWIFIIAVCIIACLVIVMGTMSWWAGYQKGLTIYQQPTVRQQQEYLNSLDMDRYRCEIDGIAGDEFGKALNNWSVDQWHIYQMENTK